MCVYINIYSSILPGILYDDAPPDKMASLLTTGVLYK